MITLKSQFQPAVSQPFSSRMKERAAPLMLAFALVTAPVTGQPLYAADKTADKAAAVKAAMSPLEAMKILLPAEKELIAASKIADPAQRKAAEEAASQKIYDSKKQVGDIFGVGAEAQFTFAHNGKSYTVWIDCDSALLRLTKGGFGTMSTMALMEPVHEAVMQGVQTDAAVESQMSRMAATMFVPLAHPQAKSYRDHLFRLPPGEKGYSTHEADPDIIRRIEQEILEPRTRALNERLKNEMRAAGMIPAAPAPANP